MPGIHRTVFIADGAKVIGSVSVGEHSSIWYNAVIRGDENHITIGKHTNIQDNCTIHVDKKSMITIGDYVSVGHGAIVHGCTIEDNCLIGMGAIVLDEVKIGKNCLVGAGALIPPRKEIPSNSLVVGFPAKVVRTLSDEEIEDITKNANVYCELAERARRDLNPG